METTATFCSISDDELMQGILAADQTAFNELYARHHPLLRRIIGQMLLSGTDVEETVQDVFVEVWNRAANFDPAKGKALGWIICMARRRAVDRQRRGCRRMEIGAMLKESADNGTFLAASESSEADAQEHLASRDLRRALDGTIQTLPSEQQAVVRQVFFQQLSQRQIAARTGLPLGTVKTRLELAMSKLHKRSEHLRADIRRSA